MNDPTSPNLARRRLLKGLFGLGAAAVAGDASAAPLRFLKPLHVDNPLAGYPNRDWEKAYRNIFKPDSSFVFLCAPNDTHNCLLRAYVKNGVVARIGPTFGYGKAEDLYGNRASSRWDPRICQKGLALVRRIYGDRRVKSPMIRKGYMDWVRAGFPRDAVTGKPDAKYFQRGKDKWLRVSWDDAYRTMAQALDNIMRTYSGPAGAARLSAQGYDPSMVEAMHGAGTQTVKVRGGMAFLGATRIYGLYRVANSLALSDAKIRGVGPEEAVGARGWDSYSWHTDLPPGHPMVTGQPRPTTSICSPSNTRSSRVIWGMNWITTKMPDSPLADRGAPQGHEGRGHHGRVQRDGVQGGRGRSSSARAPTRRSRSGLAQVIVSRKLYDAKAWVRKNTDLPFLIRMDTCTPLRPVGCHRRAMRQQPRRTSTWLVKAGEKPGAARPASQQSRWLGGHGGGVRPFMVVGQEQEGAGGGHPR
jgi:nitrate reductase alpha subunit